MNLLIPIGGTGERFRQAGTLTPKPLIPVNGKPLIEWALASYPLGADYIFVINQQFPEFRKLRKYLPDFSIVFRCPTTKGPVETCLYAAEAIDNSQELLIADCDSLIDPDELQEAIAIFRAMGGGGGVTVRHTTDPNCSFAKIENGLVVETREKDPFTDVSTTGPYWFRHGEDFVAAAGAAMKAGHTSVSPVYNFLKGKVIPFEVKTFRHLGTPEELRHFTDSFSSGVQ